MNNHPLMKSGRVILISFLFSIQSLTSLGQAPKYSNEFMNLGAGAQTFGVGLSAVSYINDATSGYWNPAGLNSLKTDHQLVLMHSAYFGGIANYDFGAFAMKLDSVSHVGISVLRFSVDDIADTRFLIDGAGSINYDNIRYFAAADYAVIISYARKLPYFGGLDMGGNVKIIRRVVGEFASAWGFGLDVGLQKSFGKWQVGATGKDIFGTFNSWAYNNEELAQTYSQTNNAIPQNGIEVSLPRLILGGSRRFDFGERFSLLTTLDAAVTFDGKRNTLIKSDPISIDPYGGIEFGYKQMAYLRLGVSQFQQTKDFDHSQSWSFQPSAGIGISIKELTIDYAFTDLGNQAAGLYSHVFSVKVDFYAPEK